VLEKAESARAKRKQSNRLTDEFLKSVFLEMFGDPVRNPKGWEVKTIGELIEENTLECLDSMRIPLKESDRAKRRGIIPYYGANGLIDYIDGFIFDEHLLLLAEDGGYWEPFTKSSYRINGKSWVNNHSHVLKAKDEPLLYYLEYFLNIVDLRSYISGTTRGKLTQSDMRRIKISLPGPLEQQKFAAIVQKVEKLKQKQRESEKEIDNLFNSLMQKAFKGELL
jgi:type I restriction enzyme S subunit